MAISGAAFSTGMGCHTSLGLSLLAGLANIRLGYWWDSGVEPASRNKTAGEMPPRKEQLADFLNGAFAFQIHLLDEWLARFHGPARQHWYLSDGGHYENTAVYELLRRRMPHIICCDCGADPSCNFTDLRKARIDFGAEVKFVPRSWLNNLPFRQSLNIPEEMRLRLGTCEDFDRGRKAGKQPHALLAAVRFDPDQTGKEGLALISFLKPALAGNEPIAKAVSHSATNAGESPSEPFLLLLHLIA